MKQSNAPSTRSTPRQALHGLVGTVLGVVVTLLVVLLCAGLFAAIGRAAGYTPALARATTQPPAGPAIARSVEGATAVTADRRPSTLSPSGVAGQAVTVITATLYSSARFAPSGVLSVTFEAAQIGGDILFAPPALQVADRELTACPELVEGATPESLKTTRLAMLDAITEGKATATLTFDDVPPELALSEVEWAQRGKLVFNPSSQPGSIVNPRIEAVVEWGE